MTAPENGERPSPGSVSGPAPSTTPTPPTTFRLPPSAGPQWTATDITRASWFIGIIIGERHPDERGKPLGTSDSSCLL